jgi:Meiotically up-regulated gene 113
MRRPAPHQRTISGVVEGGGAVTGYLYVICGTRDGEAVGPCKVGRTYKPDARLKGLQTSSPYKLHIYEVWDFPNRHEAKAAEHMAHAALKRHRLSGEWFDISPVEAVNTLTIWFYWAAKYCSEDSQDGEPLPPPPAQGVGMVANGRADDRGRIL